jgi:riboflavin kinase/FMN adenylyltransferase
VRIGRTPAELDATPRAIAIGTFDGLHRGHQVVVRAALDEDGPGTVVTFWPHPRIVFGHQVELLGTLERRLELFEAFGVEETLVVEFTPEIASMDADTFVREWLRPIGTETVVAGEGFRFGRHRSGDMALFASLGLGVREVPIVEGISSTRIRALVHDGEIEEAAGLLGRPVELDGIVVGGDRRGGTLGFPTANLRVAPESLVPPYGIYAGAVGDRRAAISIGVNPHYGGFERRIEAYLLDWTGDLYGDRIVLELWQRLRDERAFASEQELIDQIARDVEQTRAAVKPA